MKHIDLILAIAALLLAGICQPVFAQQAEGAVGPVQDAIASEEQVAVDYSSVVHFGGPASTGAQVKSDAEEKESPFRFRGLTRYLQPYYDFKTRLNKEHGFSFGADYNLLYQDASKSLGEDDAAGGVFRLYATWHLTGRGTSNNGALVFKAENRHRIETAIAPQQLGSEFGYAGLTAITYSNAGTLLTNLFWLQSFNNDR
ncbi:MAG TPA: hypothetical protein VMW70_02855, partial [Burkholderiales bacterium]|nr:hypothetical protein [Burkholderiales bacterium]